MSEIVKVEENKLAVIVQNSGLEPSKAQYILDHFQDYFKIAADWEQQAKGIVVTSAGQKEQMALARVGRLFLREKRIAIESSRKELKEQSLREGKAIDGIANVLKALIVPIEEYLDKQERFVEIQAAAEVEKVRLALEAQAEKDRIAKEAAERMEQIRVRAENTRLKEEAAKKEKALAAERAAAEAERKAIEDKARAEREEAERLRKAAEAKAQKEREAIEAKARAEKAAAEAEKQRLIEEMKATVECPNCHTRFKPER